MFAVVADHAPLTYIPVLVQYYQAALVLSWLSFLLFVIERCLEKYPPESEPWQWLKKIVQMSLFRLRSSVSNNSSKMFTIE